MEWNRKERKIIMKKEEIKNALKKEKARSHWKRGVIAYAIEILDNSTESTEISEKALLNGASNWKEYSEGCSLIYDEDICRRLCAPWEIKRKRMGTLPPNNRETWLDVQARALAEAAQLILKISVT